MSNMRSLVGYAAAVAAVIVLTFATLASADIIDEWLRIAPPPPPELKAVTLSGATTAVIFGDMNQEACPLNPRCAATKPSVKVIHEKGRAAGAMFWYSIAGGANEKIEMTDPAINPRDPSEWERVNGPDKFRGSKLEEKLRARKIERAVICGHSFQGFGVGTATGLALRGFDVIVPVDCLASNHPYPEYMEQYSVWHLYRGGNGVAPRVTITRSSMVTFTK